jgi:hypothetical protein
VDTATTPFNPLDAAVEWLPCDLVASCETGFESFLNQWNGLVFNPADVAGWSPSQARQGLVSLERLTRSVAATQTVLIGRLAAGRDTTATIVRETGMSRRSAREFRAAAKVVSENPDALGMLSSGEVSTEHLAHLSHVSSEMATDLLGASIGTCADDYKKLVDEHRVRRESKMVDEDQRNSRSIKFFTKPNGCVGATIVLPPVEGTELKTMIQDLCDQAWKQKHPERADVLGGHDDDPYERRMADAFVQFIRGARVTGKPSVIVVINAETLNAHIVPDQAITTKQAMEVMARADVYASIRSTRPAQLMFGRNRRVATHVQKLAMLMHGETCSAAGCAVSALDCDAHHIRWFERGGLTDIDNFDFRCRGEQGHHPHTHETGPPGES